MAPSMSPVLPVRALDVRQASPYVYDPLLGVRDDSDVVHLVARGSSGVSGAVIGLAVMASIIAVVACAALWVVIRQRQQLKSLGTIRVAYNVNNLEQDAKAEETEKGVSVSISEFKRGSLESVAEGEKLYTIDLSDGAKPKLIPSPNVATHMVPPTGMRRKFSRNTARQKLRIMIPSGVAIPDVELVTTAALAKTPRTGISSAVSATAGRMASLARRSTARTPRSALSSAMSAISTAAINVVHRREKVEPALKSNGWAPASIVYLPQNPRDAGPTEATVGTTNHTPRKLPRKPVRRAATLAVGPGEMAKQHDLVM